MPLMMYPGDKDDAGRILRRIVGKLVLARSRQFEPVAICLDERCTSGEGNTPWRREGQNAVGTGIRHAAAFGHFVQITRTMVTEYDGASPLARPDVYINRD